MQRLLERMAQIQKMERGKLCKMGGRPHFNHQTWEDGRNVARYVPAAETEFVQEAIEGYKQFIGLAEQYADEVIKQTREERKERYGVPPKKTRAKKSTGQGHDG